MSNKKTIENPKNEKKIENNNLHLNSEEFSFLELDNFLSQEISKKDNNNNNKKNIKKKISQEKNNNNNK